MPTCSLRFCKNYSQKTKKYADGITFHMFPRPGNAKREQWTRFVQNERREYSWLPSQRSYICSKHFPEEDCYMTKNGRRFLKKNAVPISDPQDSNENIAPTSILQVYISESEPILDTTRKIILEKDSRKSIAVKNNLIKKNRKLKRRCRYLKSKTLKLMDIIKKLKSNFLVESLVKNENKLLKQAAFVETLISLQKKYKQPVKQISYYPSVRRFALTLYYYSAAAYEYVRKTYNNALPHPRIISSSYGSVKAEPGFTEEAFKVLEVKSANASPEKPVLCSLVFDEMSIRHQKLFKNSNIGLVNFGTGPQEEKATQALVFMLVSLTENWKIPIGYFLVSGVSAETKATLIKVCLEKCYKVGVRVVSLTFDGCTTNLRAVETLGCQLSDVAKLKTYFSHPSTLENVYVFIDPCHVIKLLRNAFENRKIFFDENKNKVKWQLLVNVNKLEQDEGLLFTNKLSPRYIHFRNQIMKIKLATQLFSRSVAKALELCAKTFKSTRFLDSDSTINFITLMNDLFDVLNSQRCHFYGYKRPLCSKNKDTIFSLLNKAKSYILSLRIQVKQTRIIKRRNRDPRIIVNILKKRVVESQTRTGFVGALVCIESLKEMYLEMVEEKGVISYISTHRLSQDHLDLFFGCIRKHAGNENNPHVLQFRTAYKKVLSHLELKSSFTGNCIPLDNFTILTTTSVSIINSTSGTNRHEDEEFQVYQNDNKLLNTDILASVNCEILAKKLNNVGFTSTSKLIVGYISGYVSRKLAKLIKCEECVTNLTINNKLWHHKLITIKDMGGLCYSSQNVFQICLKTEAFIRTLIRKNGGQSLPAKYRNINYIVANTLKEFLNSSIFYSMSFHAFQQPETLNHRTHLIRAVIEKYSYIRLHHKASTDPEISFYTKRQKFPKLILFDGK